MLTGQRQRLNSVQKATGTKGYNFKTTPPSGCTARVRTMIVKRRGSVVTAAPLEGLDPSRLEQKLLAYMSRNKSSASFSPRFRDMSGTFRNPQEPSGTCACRPHPIRVILLGKKQIGASATPRQQCSEGQEPQQYSTMPKNSSLCRLIILKSAQKSQRYNSR